MFTNHRAPWWRRVLHDRTCPCHPDAYVPQPLSACQCVGGPEERRVRASASAIVDAELERPEPEPVYE